MPRYDAERRLLTISCALRPDTAYALQLNSPEHSVMADEKGHLLAPFVLRFKTRK